MTKTKRVVPTNHVVLFYDSDEELRRSAATFLSQALLAGGVMVVIATEAHRAMLEQELVATGLDLEELQASRSWLALDAAETIDRFVKDGRSDPRAFASVFGQLFAEASEQGRPIYAFGEMVALLWEARHINAAIELEALWNDLGEQTPFSLFCAYAATSMSDSSLAHEVDLVCSRHSRVVDPLQPGLVRPVRQSAQAFMGTPDAVTQARHFTSKVILAWGLNRIAQDAQLIVSELAGNAVRHARSGFTVTISAQASSLRISVADESNEQPTRKYPAESSRSGRGLMLVDALSADWGVERLEQGKTVWADLRP